MTMVNSGLKGLSRLKLSELYILNFEKGLGFRPRPFFKTKNVGLPGLYPIRKMSRICHKQADLYGRSHLLHFSEARRLGSHDALALTYASPCRAGTPAYGPWQIHGPWAFTSPCRTGTPMEFHCRRRSPNELYL